MVLTEFDEKTFVEAIKQEGIILGSDIHLIKQICCKLKKNKSANEIAEALEEDISKVTSICNALAKYAPDYKEESVINDLIQSKNVLNIYNDGLF